METILLFFAFLLGAVIGSFLNVVIYRFNTGMGLSGRSICLYCGKELRFYEMVPILSFLFLGGRCASCKSRLSLQYPLVELSAALFFTFAAAHATVLYGGGMLAVYATYLFLMGSILIVIAAYDMRHTVIPDALSFLFAALALVRILFFPGVFESTLLALLAGPLFAFPFLLLFLVSKGRWMGLGDAKLALGLGWLLGAAGSVVAFLLSFWIGGTVALVLLALRKKGITIKSEIPFAPFLALGTGIALFVPAAPFLLFFFGL